jgi:hypothetical protein
MDRKSAGDRVPHPCRVICGKGGRPQRQITGSRILPLSRPGRGSTSRKSPVPTPFPHAPPVGQPRGGVSWSLRHYANSTRLSDPLLKMSRLHHPSASNPPGDKRRSNRAIHGHLANHISMPKMRPNVCDCSRCDLSRRNRDQGT